MFEKGDVVQIDPSHDDVFGGSFMLVTEPKSWGAMGFVVIPGQGNAYYRVPFDKCVKVGKAEWIPTDLHDEVE